MTDYERLAIDLGTTVARAHQLAIMAWEGKPLPDREAVIVAAWETRTLATSWDNTVARQKALL